MPIKDNVDLVQLISEIKKCHGEVYLETDEGDRLNLKSTLSQYIFVSLGASTFVPTGRIVCSDDFDYQRLQDFLSVL